MKPSRFGSMPPPLSLSYCLSQRMHVPRAPGIPETLSGGPQGQNHFYNKTKMLRVLLIVLTSTVTVQRRQWVTLPASEQSWVVAPGPTAVHVSATMRSRQEEGTYSSALAGAVTLTSLPRPPPAGHGHSFVTICVKSWRGGGPREALPRISTALLGKGAPGLLAASLFQTQLLLDRR